MLHSICAASTARHKEIMSFNTHIIESVLRPLQGLSRPKQPQPSGTLSRQQLQRIVAEMLG